MTTIHSLPSASALSRSGLAPSRTAHQQLRNQLIALPFPEFARCLARLLSELGYEEVRLMGATHARGRNAYGGFDLQATACHGLTRSLLLAQVKQYRHPVPRSFVDELRGAMLRMGAQQGLLLTTSAFSPAAQEAAFSAQDALPVRLVNGEELFRLLLQHNVTVRSEASATASEPPAMPPATVDGIPEEGLPPSAVSVTLIVGLPDIPAGKPKRPRK